MKSLATYLKEQILADSHNDAFPLHEKTSLFSIRLTNLALNCIVSHYLLSLLNNYHILVNDDERYHLVAQSGIDSI